MMKTIIITAIFTITFTIFGQSSDKNVNLISGYTDSIDNVIKNSDGLQGGVLTNTVLTNRNVRAIGMQETKITFYYMQKDDSIYDDGKSVRYILRNNPPLKVLVQYNIAASQSVGISYYFDKELNYYKFISEGEYGYDEQRYWFNNSDPLKYVKYESANSKPTIERNDKFSKEEYSNALLVLDHAREYIALYEMIFKAEQLDK